MMSSSFAYVIVTKWNDGLLKLDRTDYSCELIDWWMKPENLRCEGIKVWQTIRELFVCRVCCAEFIDKFGTEGVLDVQVVRQLYQGPLQDIMISDNSTRKTAYC
jgi:hypothetical protein